MEALFDTPGKDTWMRYDRVPDSFEDLSQRAPVSAPWVGQWDENAGKVAWAEGAWHSFQSLMLLSSAGTSGRK